MAAIAGSYGDGFNTPAGHPELERLIAIARRERAASGRDPATFEVSVFAGLSEQWLAPAGPRRARLEQLGVDRLILLIEPPFAAGAIREAGRMLRQQ
jgi:alkanesulfonate monooxygenase SsuD/methylene tetrahydromethanopterin reductase-like flavin-dependent oxidoreductase (luciferase family)